MGIERFYVHRSIPSGAHGVRQPLGIVLIGLVHLHLKRRTGISRIETDHVEPAPAQFMYKPWRHRASFNPNARIIARMPPHSPFGWFWLSMTLTAPEPPTGIVNDTD